METLSSFDLISAGLIIFSGVFAYYRGFIKEVLLILNWFLAIVAAYLISPLIFTTISGIDFVMGLLGDSCELMMILSFIPPLFFYCMNDLVDFYNHKKIESKKNIF